MRLENSTTSQDRPGREGFSLLEMLAATAVFLLLIGVVLKMTQATADSWSNSTGKTEGFRDARAAFSTITKAVSLATLNPYFDYADASGAFRGSGSAGSFVPKQYLRRSDLHFVTGKSLLSSAVPNAVTHAIFFQAPLGFTRQASYVDMDGFLNACGFYVFYGSDPSIPTNLKDAVPAPHRFRLMQFLQPSEKLAIYDSSITGGNPNWDNPNWFTKPIELSDAPVSQLAENVVALLIVPKYSDRDGAASNATLTDAFEYDSRNSSTVGTHNQLPPSVEVVLVVIDETSAARLVDSASPPSLGLETLFQKTADLEADLATLERNLGAIPGNSAGNAIPLRYQIFRTEISLRGSKWSTQK